MKTLGISYATLEQIESILSEPEIVARRSGEFDTPDNATYLLTTYGQARMLVEVLPVTEHTVEVHIACPKDSIIASRVLALTVMKYLTTAYCGTVTTLITSAPIRLPKVNNFLIKLGFKLYLPKDIKPSMMYYKYTTGE